MTTKAALKAMCPECDGVITFQKRPALETLVTCPHCESTLEVVNDQPIELMWMYEFDDDEYDDDDYDDDEFDYDDYEDEDEG